MSSTSNFGIGSYSSVLTGASPAASGLSAKSGDTPDKIAKAASQFESLLIGQFLKAAREAGGSGWMGTDSEDADAGMIELAEQQLSQALSTRGGFGLAKLVQQGLSKAENKTLETSTKSE